MKTYQKKSSPIIFQAPPFLLDWSLSLSRCVWLWVCMRVYLCTLYGLMIASIRRHFPTKVWFDFILYACVRVYEHCYGRLFPSMCVCMCAICVYSVSTYVFAHAFFMLASCDGCITSTIWNFCLPELQPARIVPDRANVFWHAFRQTINTHANIFIF